MHKTDQEWMAYIDAEVRAACGHRGFVSQVRRKWSVREKAVSESPVEDYEWKLIPHHGELADVPPDLYEGCYYILCFDRANRRFLFQHDSWEGGDVVGPQWEVTTYTEIRPLGWRPDVIRSGDKTPLDRPPVGWLRDHLLRLMERFEPNTFSVT